MGRRPSRRPASIQAPAVRGWTRASHFISGAIRVPRWKRLTLRIAPPDQKYRIGRSQSHRLAQPGILINAQALGGSVTGAGGNEIPEQHLVYTFLDDFEFEVLLRSSRTGGQPLLVESELRAPATVLRRLHEHFLPRWPGTANAVDVEFLLAGADRHVVILQARPYTVTYGPGQRLEDAE